MDCQDPKLQRGERPVVADSADVVSRRKFLALASGCALCAAGATLRAATDRPVDVGPLGDYPRDVISEKFIQYDFFVIRHRGRLFAATAICPHKANALLLSPQNPERIICSGHESQFDPDGMPVAGQARRGLARFAIALNPQGRVIVDMSRQFAQKQWGDPASHVAMPPAKS